MLCTADGYATDKFAHFCHAGITLATSQRRHLRICPAVLFKNPHNVFGNGDRHDGKRDGENCLFEDAHAEDGSMASIAGNIIKAEWFKEYEIAPAYSDNDLLIISLDTAMKGTQLADYSVATVWLARGDHSYLLDLWRERVDYPELRRAVWRLREKYAGASLLVEDKGSGTSLIQDLRAENRAVIGINPEGDKLTRAAKTSAQFEAGAVFFPKAAPWLSALKAELLGFPNVRYDDQVDSVTQALAWIEKRKQSYVPIVCPIIVRVHNPYREAFPDYRDVPR